jgi:tRNA-2-methylthio-N6-dimethylallyladenosine synthase
MKRGYTALEFKSTVRKLRAVRPGISISSDFIVGFPGETGADFERTMALVEDVGFDHSFSFIYSPRPGTPAAQLADETPHSEKLERLQLQAGSGPRATRSAPGLGSLHTSGRRPSRHTANRWADRVQPVVNFAAADELAGRLIDVRITEVRGHSLRGEPVLA